MYVARQLAVRYATELGDRGFAWQDYVVLSLIEAVPGLHQQGISERTGLDRTTLSALLADLEDDGLVTREADPLDTRRLCVSATSLVGSALNEMRTAMEAAERVQLRPLTARQRQSLETLLAKLIPERQTLTEQVLSDLW